MIKNKDNRPRKQYVLSFIQFKKTVYKILIKTPMAVNKKKRLIKKLYHFEKATFSSKSNLEEVI
ncbi:MAG: hypothetical protein ACTSWY_06710 [Promethearchaeota archaeon]